MAARLGVLSDVAIKHHCPEYFPPDIGVQKAMHPLHLQTNIFKGIKIPKETNTQTEFARFPITDLQNFAMVAAPARTPQALMQSVYNYRKEIGSTNVPSDIQEGYALSLKDTHLPFMIKRPMEDDMTSIATSSDLSSASTLFAAPAELTLGRSTRKAGMKQFDAEFQVAKSFMQPETRAMLTNIASSGNLDNVLESLFPGGFGPRGPVGQGYQTHGEVLSKLNKMYHGDRTALATIARAHAAAQSQGVVPDQSTFMSSIFGYRQQEEIREEQEVADEE
tara:strand:+ start:2034 stop:2867 length:834 start_codon:yes stop_codon:yes gene_type:complete